jgi:hypothetical protein
MAKKNQQGVGNAVPAPEVLMGTDQLPANVELADGVSVPLGDIVRRAHADSGLDVAAWNALPETDRDAAILAARDVLAAEAADEEEQEEQDEQDLDLVECAVLHDSIYGKHDQIIELDAVQAEAARAAGYVDTHPNAIKAIRETA